MALHHVFVIAADIKEGYEDHLRALDPRFQLSQTAPKIPPLPPPDLSKLEMLHYASFVVFDRERLFDPDELENQTPRTATRSKLVFECNIDGSRRAFLNRLLDDVAIDGIYRLCEEYPLEGTKKEKLAYLMRRDRLRRPQLVHIGAPRRSVRSIREDLALRQQLDADLGRLTAGALTNYRSGTSPGMREYGTWDALSPWAAWIVGILVPALTLGSLLAAKSTLPKVPFIATAVFGVVISAIAMVAGFKMWIGVVPGVRDRARPWVKWTLAGVVVAAIAYGLWGSGHPRWALGLAGLYVVGIGYKAYAAFRDRGNDRLRLIRSSTSGPSVAATWKALRRDVPRGDSADWLLRIVNWSIWPIAGIVVYVPIWWKSENAWVVLSGLTILFFLKGLWLSVLLGWPARADQTPEDTTKYADQIRQDRTRIFAFIVGLPAVAFGAFFVLIRRGLLEHPLALAIIVLVALFSLWAIPLPSPPLTYAPVDREKLARILNDEDHDATNHMSAVVVLNRDHRYRVPVLKSFLWLLDRFYYRAVVPDIYRGKLFGVPTVHFAQWILLDDRNFLFLSNYDDSWTSYLDDFGLTLTTGIQKIWGQGINNPGTKDLVRFKDYARTTMVQHSFWYRAYPGLTLRQVWNNEQIRRAVDRARDEEAMMRALERFGAATKILPGAFHARSL